MKPVVTLQLLMKKALNVDLHEPEVSGYMYIDSWNWAVIVCSVSKRAPLAGFGGRHPPIPCYAFFFLLPEIHIGLPIKIEELFVLFWVKYY